MVYLGILKMSSGAQIVALCALATALVGLGARIVVRMAKGDPEKRERKRRLHVHRNGRLGDAFITEATESILYYSYSISGVQYTASQEIGSMRALLPSDPERLIGPVSLKYSSKNPANSILICEEWSGLRVPSRAA
jgi:hypothetical protein